MSRRCTILGLALLWTLNWLHSAGAQAIAQDKRLVPHALAKGPSVRTITPIFSQLLVTGSPAGFQPGFEKARDTFYIRESVPKGESVDNWRQIITVTGAKDLAAKPDANPKTVINNMAEGYKRGCPGSFSSQGLSEGQIEGFDAIVAMLACGTSAGTQGKTSEVAMIVVIKGKVDFYTVQWAERGTPSSVPLPIDVKKWTARFQQLQPIKLCPIVAREAAPYPSCVGPIAKLPIKPPA